MPECVQRVTASGRFPMSVWGVVTAEKLEPLVSIKNHFNAADSYSALLDDVLLPYLVGGPFHEEDFILQPDHSLIHK